MVKMYNFTLFFTLGKKEEKKFGHWLNTYVPTAIQLLGITRHY